MAGALLVGISNPETSHRLVRLSAALARSNPGMASPERPLLLIHVVAIANQISLGTGRSSPEVIHARDLLQGASAAAREAGAPARAIVEVARNVEEGLLSAADSHGADMILVGYSGGDGPSDAEERFDRTMHRVARKAQADVIVAKFRRDEHRTILVPIAENAPLRLTGRLCRALADGTNAVFTFLHVSEPGASVDEARDRITAQLDAAGLGDDGQLRVVVGGDPAVEIIKEAGHHHLLVLGPSARPGILDAVFSSRARKIAESVSASVVLGWSLAEE